MKNKIDLLIKTLELHHIDFLKKLVVKPECFGDKPTCSEGKNLTESYQDSQIGPILRILNKENETKCAVLIGHVKGLKRQLERYKNNLGFSEENIVIFEWEPNTANKLKQAVKRRGLKCTVICCDLIKGVEALSRIGFNFSYIEFDSVQRFGTQEPKLYALVKKWSIPVLVTQGSGRGQHQWYKTRAEKLGAKHYLNHGYKCFKLKDCADKIINQSLKEYDSHLITYGGREYVSESGKNAATPMYMAISLKAA